MLTAPAWFHLLAACAQAAASNLTDSLHDVDPPKRNVSKAKHSNYKQAQDATLDVIATAQKTSSQEFDVVERLPTQVATTLVNKTEEVLEEPDESAAPASSAAMWPVPLPQ